MSFEKFTPEENKLSPEDAQQEANMVRAKMGASPETGKIPRNWIEAEDPKWGKEPTAEDYEDALGAVEEMKRLAKEEPSTEKVLKLIGRIAERTRDGTMVLLRALSPMPNGIDSQRFLEKHESIMDQLEDASNKLNELKNKAKKFEQPKKAES